MIFHSSSTLNSLDMIVIANLQIKISHQTIYSADEILCIFIIKYIKHLNYAANTDSRQFLRYMQTTCSKSYLHEGYNVQFLVQLFKRC